jgi:membrane protein implicated in regulation of membrane protease activity
VALPVLGAIVGGLSVVALIGISGGVLLAAVVVALAVFVWRWRRRLVSGEPNEGGSR